MEYNLVSQRTSSGKVALLIVGIRHGVYFPAVDERILDTIICDLNPVIHAYLNM